MRKRFLAVFLALCLVLSLLPGTALAAEVVASGECGAQGDNLTWTLDSDGLLTISGTGEMTDWGTTSTSIWYRDERIKDVVVEDGVTTIGNNAFYDCPNLTSVTIPNSVTSIGAWVFNGCTSLIGITIPSGITSISARAFAGCTSLTSITIPDGVTSIDTGAFAGCTSLISVTMPNSVTSIGVQAFLQCDNLIDVYYSGTEAQWRNIDISADGNEYLTNARIIKPLTFVGECGAQGDNLTFRLPPDGILTISGTGDMKDWGSASGTPWSEHREEILNIVLEDGVTSIGNQAFGGCTGLSKITIPDSVTSIGYHTFAGCYSLSEITIPDSVTSIGDYVFVSCFDLSEITIPDSVTSIGDGAFYGCTSLSDVYYSGTKAQWSAVTIEDEDEGDRNAPLHNATIHCSDGDITPKEDEGDIIASGECGAQGDNLTWTLDTNGLLTVSGTGKMKNYSESENAPWREYTERNPIRTVIIENGVTSLGNSAFQSLSDLTAVTISSSVESIGVRTFRSCVNLSDIVIPNGVKSIEYDSFSYCSTLTTVQFPDSVVDIGLWAFSYCTSLSSVTIPLGITSIPLGMFYNCDNLTDVYYSGTKAQWKGVTIENYGNNNHSLLNATIHCSDGIINPKDDNEGTEVKELEQGVKYVPYSYKLEGLSGANYAGWSPRTPQGIGYSFETGEIYGVPLESGTFELTIGSNEGDAWEGRYRVTILDNTNSAVQRPNDYDIIENVGTQDPRDPNNFYMTEYREETFAVNGPYQEFYRLLIDGREKVRDVDYTVREGSTIITVRAQTFRNVGEGTHTIAAEFRSTDSNGKTTTKQVAQNYTLTIRQPSNNTGNHTSSSNSSSSSSSGSTNYSITVPKIPNCTIKVTPTSASAGTRVALTVKPYTGYLLDSVTVTGPNGSQIALTQTDDGKYTFRMPSGKVDISVQVSVEQPAPIPAGDTPFTDISETDWFYSAVCMAYQRGWMVGVSADTFAPQAETSRGMIVSVLHRIAGQPTVSNSYFTDVPLNQYYTTAAAWAAEQGIITGYGDGRFGPSDSLTREQIVMILYNYACKTGMDTTAHSEMTQFADLDQLSAGAQVAMSWAHAVGLVSGMGNGNLDPDGTATRAEMAAFLARFITLAENH